MSKKEKCNNKQVLILKANHFIKQDDLQGVIERMMHDIKYKGVVVIPYGFEYSVADLAGVIEKNEG